jgi:type II secretory pathway pseudopilin PulG
MKLGTLAQRLKSRGGFSLVESVVAVVLISAVGMIVVQLLHKNTLNLIWSKQTRKAAALADMVLEKYDYLATVNFPTLEQHNQNKTSANAFFASGANMQGYEGMGITTVASAPTANGTRLLTVTINWGNGGPRQTFKLSKYLAPGAGDPGGAPVYVYVTNPAGQGVSGFEVRAKRHYNPAYTNAIGTNEVIGYTDANGYAVLNNVAIAAAYQPMEIYARKPGSDAVIAKSNAGYAQGYYAPGTGTWNTKTINLTQTSANIVRFEMANNDFRPLGSVSGQLTNLSGGPVNGMQIRFLGKAVNGTGNEVENATWDLTTDNSGHYEFNNVASGLFNIHVVGDPGSEPAIPPGPGFRQGYAGAGSTTADPWWYEMTMLTPPTDVSNYNVQVQALGSLELTVRNLSNTLLPGATVSFELPDIGGGNRGTWMGAADSNAMVRLYNVFARSNESVRFSALVYPAGCSNPGNYLYQSEKFCNAGQTNVVSLSLNNAAQIQGTLTDNGSPAVPLQGIEVSVPGLDGSPVYGMTAADGSFTLCGISPSNITIPSWPTVRFSYTDQTSRRVAGTFSGFVVDGSLTSMRLPTYPIVAETRGGVSGYVHNGACMADANPTNTNSDTIVSDPNGAYGPVCGYFRISGSRNKSVSGGPTTYTSGAIAISTSTARAGFMDGDAPYFNTPEGIFTVTNGQIYPSRDIVAHLAYYNVRGVVRDSTGGIPLQGITFDPCQEGACEWAWNRQCPVTTAADGSYGPVAACVSRTGQGGSPGRLEITIPSGVVADNTGKTYSGGSQTRVVNNPPTPATPLTVDFVLDRTGGGI